MTDLNISIDTTKTAMTLQVNDGPSITLRAEQVETLLATLADMRSTMDPPVKSKMADGLPKRAVNDPQWVQQAFDDPENMPGLLFSICHPGMGWLPFVIRPESARRMGANIAEFLRILEKRALSPEMPATRN